MKEDNSRKEILDSVKDRVRISEERQRVQMIADAIGERRDRDLLDLLSQFEQDRGWGETLEYLSKASISQYSIPIGAGPSKVNIEEIKFREAIFSIFKCTGLEAISIKTNDILEYPKTETSLVDASRSVRKLVESLAKEQVEKGDLLFFDLNMFDSSISKKIHVLVKKTQQSQIDNITLTRTGNEIDVLPLWYTEIGRQTLAQIGIKGSRIDSESLDIVLSVIQKDIPVIKSSTHKIDRKNLNEPSNIDYRKLLTTMINHDIEGLNSLSSRFAFPTIKAILDEATDRYYKNPTSDNYRELLASMNAHVRIRTIDSIEILERLCTSEEHRIATTAITALGNFYHESSAWALVNILCQTKNHEIAEVATRAIINVHNRCAETKSVILSILESGSCKQKKFLKQLKGEIIRNESDYYE